MTKVTHPMLTRILTGIGLMAAATLSVTASIVPGGAFEGRAASLRIDEPTTTTTIVAPAPAETPVVPVPAPVAVKVPVVVTTTTIAPPVVVTPPAPKNLSGHYACDTVTEAAQFNTPCAADNTVDPGPVNTNPNADPALPPNPGDQPGQTLGSTDRAYGAELTAGVCDAKPWLCEDGPL